MGRELLCKARNAVIERTTAVQSVKDILPVITTTRITVAKMHRRWMQQQHPDRAQKTGGNREYQPPLPFLYSLVRCCCCTNVNKTPALAIYEQRPQVLPSSSWTQSTWTAAVTSTSKASCLPYPIISSHNSESTEKRLWRCRTTAFATAQCCGRCGSSCCLCDCCWPISRRAQSNSAANRCTSGFVPVELPTHSTTTQQ